MESSMTSFKENLHGRLKGQISEQALLRDLTTYRIGGPARYLVYPADLQDLRILQELIRKFNTPSLILGGGANILVADRGFQGVVIHLGNFQQLETVGERVYASAGLLLDRFIIRCLKEGRGGLERLSGIPGTLGGALRMNAGAFEAEVSDCLLELDVLDKDGNLLRLSKEEAGFGYRQACGIREKWILGATFQFQPNDCEALLKTRQSTLAWRYKRQPWQYPSAGSVFKRPPGQFAGKLIEEAGLKGKEIGGAQFSIKHAGFIINKGSAAASDVLDLIRLAQREVQRQFGIHLELEQELLGF